MRHRDTPSGDSAPEAGPDGKPPRFQEASLPWLARAGETIRPDFDGGSILNLHTSLLEGFGALPTEGALLPPLRDPVVGELFARSRRIVLLVIDALGYLTFERLLEERRLPLWQQVRAAGHYRPLTTVFPSATNVVLMSLHSGLTPSAHGVPGYRLYVPAAGVVCDMIRFRVLTEAPDGFRGHLFDLGVELESFANRTLCERLSAADVPTAVVFRRNIIESHLSELNHRGADRLVPFVDTGDQMIQVRRTLRSLGDRGFIYTYWDAVDAIQHLYGAGGEEVEAEVAKLFFSLEREFLSRLSPAEMRGTLLVVVSDHGQVTVPPESFFGFHGHPEILSLMETPPAGNSRVTYLRSRPGATGRLESVLGQRLPEDFSVVPVSDVVASGLLGDGWAHPELAKRMGDLVVFAGPQAGAYYRPDGKTPRHSGQHGGLSPEEMLIPFLAVDLGDI